PDVGTPSSQSPPSTPGTTLCGRCGLRVLRGLVTLLPCGAAVSGPRSLRFADLIEAPLVPPALERRGQPQRQNLVSKTECDDAAAHGEDVRVVVLPRQAGGVEVVAERGADAGDLVGGDLLALPAAAEHDAAFGAPLGDGASDREADRRVVDRGLAVGAVIVDAVAEPRQRLFQVFLEGEAGVIGADGDSHGQRLYYGRCRTSFVVRRSPLGNSESRAANAERRTPNVERRTSNAERRTIYDPNRRHLRARRAAASRRPPLDLSRRRRRRARRRRRYRPGADPARPDRRLRALQ